uniref:Calmodulin n=1 Tax=Leptocylindrus danicus TaxID=163516 RepID=A0A7S2JSJ9_9STRA|mmetsp:Transcript_11053/g.16724  ORF Transcript_11053/g.16724 Transcript_11053/m.16724 type:complete len:556 (+) Transcript_11053:167-1834(+)
MGNSQSRKKNGKIPSRKEKKRSSRSSGNKSKQEADSSLKDPSASRGEQATKARTTTSPNCNKTQEKPVASSMPPQPKPTDNDVVMEDTGKNGPIVLDMLSDVRTKYHVNPKEIGHGHYGVVRKCMDRETKVWYAIKSIRKSKVNRLDILKREVKLLQEVRHPNIIRLEEVFEDEKYLHLVTELCTGGELFDRIIEKTQSDEGHFSEQHASVLVKSILSAIKYCHDEKHICHRDLKPENFLFKDESETAAIKIIDFGLSRHDDENFGVMKTKVGTPYYVAPEVLNRHYTNACDMWSIGVITYILLCGYPPFYGDSDSEIFRSVRAGAYDYPSPEWDTISKTAKDFIDKLLQKNPKDRMTASQAMKHPWIGGDDRCRRISLTNFANQRSTRFVANMGMKKLRKAALTYISDNLTKAELESLAVVFKRIDVDGNGELSMDELDSALSSGTIPPDVADYIRNMREKLGVDGNSNASIDWKAFIHAAVKKQVAMRDDKIRQAFESFDVSKNGEISMADLAKVFGSEAQAREIMGDADTNNDGVISYDEFKEAILNNNIEM